MCSGVQGVGINFSGLRIDLVGLGGYDRAMKRLHIHLSEQQVDRLKAESKRSGAPVAELVRRFVDRGLGNPGHRPYVPSNAPPGFVTSPDGPNEGE